MKPTPQLRLISLISVVAILAYQGCDIAPEAIRLILESLGS